jgi:hypothetical protein
LTIRQAVYLILSVLFAIFALLQYNDPDFYIWIPIYGWVAFLSFLATKGIFWKMWTFLSGFLFLVWMLCYIPSVLAWFSEGSPSIWGSMKAESPYIEHMREFLGLFLCLVAILHFYYRAKIIKSE